MPSAREPAAPEARGELRVETRRALDAYWAGVFGRGAAGLRPTAPVVLPRRAEDGFRGAYVMEFGAAPVALLSPGLMDHAARVAAVLASGVREDAEPWRDLFGGAVDAVVGPAALRCADRGTFRPLPPSHAARLLTRDDLPHADALRRACTHAEWEHGGSRVGEDVAAGAFAGGELAALAGYEVWGGSIAHLAIVAHPAHRGQGHAAAAVSRAAAEALDRGLVAQYRTLESNAPSLAIADRLGFRPYARSLAVRLHGARRTSSPP